MTRLLLCTFFLLPSALSAQHRISPMCGAFPRPCIEYQIRLYGEHLCPFHLFEHRMAFFETTCPYGDCSLPPKCGLRHFAGSCYNFETGEIRLFAVLTIEEREKAIAKGQVFSDEETLFIELSTKKMFGAAFLYREIGDILAVPTEDEYGDEWYSANDPYAGR